MNQNAYASQHDLESKCTSKVINFFRKLLHDCLFFFDSLSDKKKNWVIESDKWRTTKWMFAQNLPKK